jgi:hypothetical protein
LNYEFGSFYHLELSVEVDAGCCRRVVFGHGGLLLSLLPRSGEASSTVHPSSEITTGEPTALSGRERFSEENLRKADEFVAQQMELHNLPSVVVGVWVPGEGEYFNHLAHREIAQLISCQLITFAVVLRRYRITHHAHIVKLFPIYIVRVSSSRMDGRTILQEPEHAVLHPYR